jgi:Flp pilus assembly CpaE family ATPase
MPDIADSAGSTSLPVALIVPDARRRGLVAAAIAGLQFTVAREFVAYPSASDVFEIVRLNCRVAVVDVDADTDQAMYVIESICSRDISITVMATSSRNDPALLRRSMQAGAREFLVEPLLPEVLSEAFSRALARQRNRAETSGKILVFVPSKGGVGVTTIAANFALTLTKESGARVAVVDMDFEMGEIALGLGMTATFSITDALMNPARLDKEFLSTLLLRHSSGLSVLASPEEYNTFHCTAEGADKLFRILRREFDYVVVDAAGCDSRIQDALFESADTLYLVTEMTLPALRNAHRLIAFLSSKGRSRGLEIVLNRFNSRHGNINENSVTKALGRPINWKIPNAYEAARAAEDSGVPLAMEDSPITRVLAQMAKAACGKPFTVEKKAGKVFSLFGSKLLPTAEL